MKKVGKKVKSSIVKAANNAETANYRKFHNENDTDSSVSLTESTAHGESKQLRDERGTGKHGIGKLGSRIKGGIVNIVGEAEQKIYHMHHNHKKRSRGIEESPSTMQTTQHTDAGSSQKAPGDDQPCASTEVCVQPTTNGVSQNGPPILAKGENATDSLILSDNSDVQLNIFLPSGQLADSSASFSTVSGGANSGGKLHLKGNKGVQLCLGGGASSTAASGGETIIEGNEKMQVYSNTGVKAEGAVGESQALKISDNKESQIMSMAQSVAHPSTEIKQNKDCQIMTASQQQTTAATDISNNTGSQIMNIPPPTASSQVSRTEKSQVETVPSTTCASCQVNVNDKPQSAPPSSHCACCHVCRAERHPATSVPTTSPCACLQLHEKENIKSAPTHCGAMQPSVCEYRAAVPDTKPSKARGVGSFFGAVAGAMIGGLFGGPVGFIAGAAVGAIVGSDAV